MWSLCVNDGQCYTLYSTTVVCWGSRLWVVDAKRLNRLICKAGDVVWVELDNLTVVSERRMLSNLHVFLDNGYHPLHDVVVSHRSTFSTRLILPRCITECHRKSFLAAAIKLFDCSLSWRSAPLLQSVPLPYPNKKQTGEEEGKQGPDRISPRLLESFADQLCRIVEYLFNQDPLTQQY